MGELLGSKFARRLAASLVAVGVGGALLTASVVNVAFGSRFSSYVHDQQSQRNRVLVQVLAASYCDRLNARRALTRRRPPKSCSAG